MKKTFVSIFSVSLAFAAFDSASAAIYLAQTETDEWAVSRNLSLVSGTTASGAVTSTAVGGVLAVGQYTGVDQLARVVIRLVQPDPVASPTIGASISIASGSDTFNASTTDNRVTENTQVFFDAGLTSDLDAAGVTVNDPASNVTRNSANYASTGITVGSPIVRSLDLTSGPTVLFDSDTESLSSAQLAAIFEGAGTLGFTFDTASSFRWSRTGTAQLTATLSGSNTGQIIIEYYAVPEPSTALLGAFSALALLRRRR